MNGKGASLGGVLALLLCVTGCTWRAEVEMEAVDGSETFTGVRESAFTNRIQVVSSAGRECRVRLRNVTPEGTERWAPSGRVRCSDGDSGAIIVTNTERGTFGGVITGVIGEKTVRGRWDHTDEELGVEPAPDA